MGDWELIVRPVTLFYCPVAKQVANNTPNLMDSIPTGSDHPPDLIARNLFENIRVDSCNKPTLQYTHTYRIIIPVEPQRQHQSLYITETCGMKFSISRNIHLLQGGALSGGDQNRQNTKSVTETDSNIA